MYDWISISEVKLGDLIRAPVGGSSWAYWRDREQAEAAASVPFLRVERIEQNAHSPELYEVSLAGNLTHWLRRDERVLRQG